ncbi:hypothetical protein BD779DRAFT_1763551 [Infundibulicybe gibba]|nr:hypothetical protein BD779DRAFT_1763551 [Infundibulicybe gibba]
MDVPPQRVIVDDTDPQIQYSGIDQWTLSIGESPFPISSNSNGPPFQNTTHLSSTTSSLSLQFRGSSPQVFGGGSGDDLGEKAPYKCYIDDTSIGSILLEASRASNNNLLCDGASFVEGKEYTLTLNFTPTVGVQPLGFDYITYIPSASFPLGSATLLVDGLDPAIAYDPGQQWSVDSLGTSTQINGSSVTFNFTGTSVSWIGFTSPIVLSDNANPVLFMLGASIDNLTNQVFFTSPTLNPGPHSLEVTYRGNSSLPPLTLNHLVIANNVSTPSLQVPPVVSASTNKPSASASIGAIVGGVIGGIAVLCLAAFLLWRRSRQRKTGHKEFGTDIDTVTPPHLTPFDAMPSGPAMADASNRTLKVHHSLVVDPPEFDPYILLDGPSGIGDVDATPRATETPDQGKLPLRAPPMEMEYEPDRSARSAISDEVLDPPPSYAS